VAPHTEGQHEGALAWLVAPHVFLCTTSTSKEIEIMMMMMMMMTTKMMMMMRIVIFDGKL
jgi:hypothetical protein